MRRLLTLTVLPIATLMLSDALVSAEPEAQPPSVEAPAPAIAPSPPEALLPETAPEPPPPPPPPEFTTRDWTLTAYRANGALAEIIAASRPTRFSFKDGRIAGSTGCNRLIGSYSLDGAIFTPGKDLAATRMACQQPLMQQEQAVIEALRQVATYQHEAAELKLLNAQSEVLLHFQLPANPPLAGQLWTLLAYNNGKAAMVTPIAGSAITLSFDDQGRLSGSDGCNRYMSGYTSEADHLSIGPIATTRMACRGGAAKAEQARAYAAALGLVTQFRIEELELTLLDAQGTKVAHFQAAPPTPTPQKAP